MSNLIKERADIGERNASAYLAARRRQIGHTPGSADRIASAHVGPKDWAHLNDTDIEALIEGRREAEGKAAVLLDVFERLHARITRDLNFEAGEAAAPEDERWALTIDAFVQFAGELADEVEAKVGY